jgi:hypothetical protein
MATDPMVSLPYGGTCHTVFVPGSLPGQWIPEPCATLIKNRQFCILARLEPG